ncbi:MAG: prenyltransferase/squalene oxidase repeat-containing protein [Planctomycetota bacterium]
MVRPLHQLLRTRLPVSIATLCVLSLGWAPAITAQQPSQQDRQPLGKVFKSEVDGLVTLLRQVGGPDLGRGSVRLTAQALTALGHCHRFYSAADGPVVKPAIDAVMEGQSLAGFIQDRNDDTDADRAVTTAWAAAALRVLEPELHAPQVRAAMKWLEEQNSADADPFRARVDAIRGAYARGEGGPEQLVARSLGFVQSLQRGGGEAPNVASVIDAMLNLVACQVFCREHDRDLKAAKNATWRPVQERGLKFLLTQQEDGTFFVETPGGRFPDTGLSSIALGALQTKPKHLRSAELQSTIEQGLQSLMASQNEDGSFGQRSLNYTTCAAILALTRAQEPRFDDAIRLARNFVLALQNVEDRGYAQSDRDYGSIGYGGDQRGDLSNLQFAVEALRASGLDAENEAFAKAIVFLQRTQNLPEVNDFEGRVRNEKGEWIEVTPGDDGGAAYYPGNSPAGTVELSDGRQIPRSYGSMTYAMLKTYTLAGLQPSDARVEALLNWLGENWSVTENPGSDPRLAEKTKYQGLYYYYMVLSQALSLVGADKVGEHDWRAELSAQLRAVQRDDGSWLNEQNGRWWENRALICTVYSLLALENASR